MSERVSFDRVAFIGLGLIGSSLARAMKRDRLAGHIAGHARSAATREKSLEIGFIDSAHETAADAVAEADLVVICTPLGTYADIGRAIAPALKDGAIVTDVGSCKQCVVDDLLPVLPAHVHLVPGHPVAGTENSGPEAGFPELFEGRFAIVAPHEGADDAAVEKVCALWRAVGSRVETMRPAHHDRVLAVTSHLPHLIAYTIVGTAADLEEHLLREHVESEAVVETKEVIKFSAGGFRDFTRIAGSDPVMWRDIFMKNRDASLEMLGRFTEDLLALQRAIRWGDAETLEELFTRTRDIRRGVVESGQAGTFIATEPPTAEPSAAESPTEED